jgi:hypothetical protein
MSAAYTNLYIEQGASYSTTITVNDVYSSTFDLSGYSVKSQMRKSYYSANATATFTTSISISTGQITLALDAPTTANISAGRYVYDATIKDTSNNVTRILEGIVDVSPSVTR